MNQSLIHTLKQFCNIFSSDQIDWLALADAYEEARNENAADAIRNLIIPFIQYKNKKIPDFDNELYSWQFIQDKPSRIEIFKYLPSAHNHYYKYYPTEEEAYFDLWLAFLKYVSERG